MGAVPGANASAYPERLVLHNLVRPILVRREALTRNLTSIAGVISPQRSRPSNHAFGNCDRLAHCSRLETTKLFGIFLEQVCKFVHNGGALVAGHVAPCWEGLLCGGDGIVDVLLSGNVDLVCYEGVVVGVVNGQ